LAKNFFFVVTSPGVASGNNFEVQLGHAGHSSQLTFYIYFSSSTLASARRRSAEQEQRLVVREGFEPSKAEPTDLQSVPFDRSGTSPRFQFLACIVNIILFFWGDFNLFLCTNAAIYLLKSMNMLT
jgi:hypothetical protein